MCSLCDVVLYWYTSFVCGYVSQKNVLHSSRYDNTCPNTPFAKLERCEAQTTKEIPCSSKYFLKNQSCTIIPLASRFTIYWWLLRIAHCIHHFFKTQMFKKKTFPSSHSFHACIVIYFFSHKNRNKFCRNDTKNIFLRNPNNYYL